MNQIWSPEDHLKDEIGNMEAIADFLMEWKDANLNGSDVEKFDFIATRCASDIERSIGEIKEIFADMSQQLTSQANGTKRINLTVTGEIGENKKIFLPPNTKLNSATAQEIRRRYLSGELSQPAMAREYGVCEMTINRIVRNRSWKEACI